MPIDIKALQAAQGILAQLYAARQSGPAGVASVVVDGQQVTYHDPASVDAAILFWERKVALLSGRRRRAASIRLDGF